MKTTKQVQQSVRDLVWSFFLFWNAIQKWVVFRLYWAWHAATKLTSITCRYQNRSDGKFTALNCSARNWMRIRAYRLANLCMCAVRVIVFLYFSVTQKNESMDTSGRRIISHVIESRHTIFNCSDGGISIHWNDGVFYLLLCFNRRVFFFCKPS